jgi:hypothetical protein
MLARTKCETNFPREPLIGISNVDLTPIASIALRFPSGFAVYPAGWRHWNFTVDLRNLLPVFYPCPRVLGTAILRFTMQKQIPVNNVTLAANDSALKA